MNTGERIRARRKQIGISAEELAKRIGVSRATIFRWEKGGIVKIPAVELSIIASILQCSDAYLFGWADDPEPEAPKTEKELMAKQTPAFRIISHGLSELPQAEQDKILAILQAMYSNKPELFSRRDDDDA